MNGPKSWKTATRSDLSSIRGVCLDIDETLSTQGKLTAAAFDALWKLHDAGLILIPITGRPAGWCDQIARFWPVDAVVGENGAFTFFMQEGVRKRIDTPFEFRREEAKEKLERLAQKIRKRFPDARWASDQAYREFDLAIDFSEDVKPWDRAEVDALVELCRAEGSHAKISSIHVNAWFGEYDKRKGMEHWLKAGAPGVAPARAKGLTIDQLLYIGDSPNDESMFEAFKLSVGVANLRQFLDRIEHRPRWITDSESGAGFAEMAEKLITLRRVES